jgi:hypothetical protein
VANKVPPGFVQRYRRLAKDLWQRGFTMDDVAAQVERRPDPGLGKLPAKSPYDYAAMIHDIRMWGVEGIRDKDIVRRVRHKYGCSASVVSRAIALSTKTDP